MSTQPLTFVAASVDARAVNSNYFEERRLSSVGLLLRGVACLRARGGARVFGRQGVDTLRGEAARTSSSEGCCPPQSINSDAYELQFDAPTSSPGGIAPCSAWQRTGVIQSYCLPPRTSSSSHDDAPESR
jgi:hypothetical protein